MFLFLSLSGAIMHHNKILSLMLQETECFTKKEMRFRKQISLLFSHAFRKTKQTFHSFCQNDAKDPLVLKSWVKFIPWVLFFDAWKEK